MTLTDWGLVAVMMTLFGTITSAQYTAGIVANSLALQVQTPSLCLCRYFLYSSQRLLIPSLRRLAAFQSFASSLLTKD